jgi:hypothetical protein
MDPHGDHEPPMGFVGKGATTNHPNDETGKTGPLCGPLWFSVHSVSKNETVRIPPHLSMPHSAPVRPSLFFKHRAHRDPQRATEKDDSRARRPRFMERKDVP